MKSWLLIPACIVLSLAARGQGTVEDYRRAVASHKAYRDKVWHAPDKFTWLERDAAFWYIDQSAQGRTYILADVAKRTQKPMFDHAAMARALSAQLHKTILATNLPLKAVVLAADKRSITFEADSARMECQLPACRCAVKGVITPPGKGGYWNDPFDERNGKPVRSPDSAWVAFIRDDNVFIRSRKTQEIFRLSYDGSGGNFYASHMTWSPDSKKLVAYTVRPGQERTMYLLESTPSDQLQPRLQQRHYLKPGDALPHKRPQLFLIDSKKHVPVSDSLFRDQYALEEIRWTRDSRYFTFEYNARGHQVYRVLQVDGQTGRVHTVVDERSDTFIDYSGKRFRHDLADGTQLFWASERSGWNHLYRYDVATGKVINAVTSGHWVLREVVHVDEARQRIIFRALGMDPGQDPYLAQYAVVNFDGTGLRRLTLSDANHVASFSKDYTYFVDHASRADLPPVSRVYDIETGREVMPVQQADITALQQAGWRAPEVFSAKGRDGQTDIWGVIIRPSKMDEGRQYPVIEMIYAGPQDFYVNKSFNKDYMRLHVLAELGFVVVQLDGMGTSWRSKAFHDVCWKNLKDAGFEDRIAWIQAAAKKYTYIDARRVGVFGGSAGGQNAAGAVIFHPEFYRAAVASCGCHDNRLDKMWWNEQWMGYPIGPQYAASSNVVHAGKLGGKLLLIVGELDDNVDPASTYQLADALIKANKDFELVTVPGMGHSGGGEFGERKRWDFFVRHLLQREPPAWEDSYPGK
ncbi:S9 family peptidase [Dawidia soli]|uniref:DPP IV N-terminal domain-containing protein n=1 Tax=Dawidia soli TaxID=2782352 RepID=A0AAP2GHG2_9BACT|nr:S9 family peptidase [Dawidia soli]MBT1685973.1 DPP IV N-terminal domain-containing protein [Dawidia soli]